jgi:hypothetical protein
MIARLKELQVNLVSRIASLCALVSGLVPDDVQQKLVNLNSVIAMLETPEVAMNKNTVGFTGAEVERAIIWLSRIERDYLVSDKTSQNLYERIWALGSEGRTLQQDFLKWRGQLNRRTEVIREGYETLVRRTGETEVRLVQARIRAATSPAPAKAAYRRNIRSGTGPAKGKNSETSKHGGFGTSRDALRRKRRRSHVG